MRSILFALIFALCACTLAGEPAATDWDHVEAPENCLNLFPEDAAFALSIGKGSQLAEKFCRSPFGRLFFSDAAAPLRDVLAAKFGEELQGWENSSPWRKRFGGALAVGVWNTDAERTLDVCIGVVLEITDANPAVVCQELFTIAQRRRFDSGTGTGKLPLMERPEGPVLARVGNYLVVGLNRNSVETLARGLRDGRRGLAGTARFERAAQPHPATPDAQLFISYPHSLRFAKKLPGGDQVLLRARVMGYETSDVMLYSLKADGGGFVEKISTTELLNEDVGQADENDIVDGDDERMAEVDGDEVQIAEEEEEEPVEGFAEFMKRVEAEEQARPIDIVTRVPRHAVLCNLFDFEGGPIAANFEALGPMLDQYFQGMRTAKLNAARGGTPFSFTKGVAALEKSTGKTLEELIGTIEGTHVWWIDRPQGLSFPSLALCVNCADADGATGLARSLSDLFNAAAKPENAIVTSKPEGARTIWTMNLPPDSRLVAQTGYRPCWAVVGRHLVVYSAPEKLAEYLSGLDKKAPSIVDNPDYSKFVASRPAEEREGLALFVDLRQLLNWGRDVSLPPLRLSGVLEKKLATAIDKLPPTQELWKGIPPVVVLSETNEHSSVYTVDSPIPYLPTVAAAAVVLWGQIDQAKKAKRSEQPEDWINVGGAPPGETKRSMPQK
ncbi:MAG TPA: hypothetical protein VGP72_22065 [Planctomycetota bacterium]|jgi:hypothetical protein